MQPTLTWLLTSTTYGTWLPGDTRGFVGRVVEARADDPLTEHRVEHDRPQTDYDRDIPALRAAAQQQMKGEPILLTAEQAGVVLEQFRETAAYRGWTLHAVAIMANHFHAVLSAPESVLTDAIMRDLKSYASRALNRKWAVPESGTWWTKSGSRRKLPDDRAVETAIRYVQNQRGCLALFPDPEPR